MTKRSVLVKNWCRPFFLLIEAEKQEDPKKFSMNFSEILYLIFDYPHKHYTFKYFAV
jgi:hypothetical protein